MRRETGNVAREVSAHRPADLVGRPNVPDEQLNARSPLMVLGSLVVEAENLGAVPNERRGVSDIGEVAFENRQHRLEVEAAGQFKPEHATGPPSW